MTPIKTLSLSLLLVLSACSTQTALIQGGEGRLVKAESQHFFVSGLGQTQTIDAAAVCGGADKVVKVERTTTFLNGLLRSLSYSIYTPEEAKVYCSS